jgi:uncharacterized HAD superfamily protein
MKKNVEVMDLDQQEFNGNTISPVLPDGVKNYLIDIDGTITEDVPNEEPWRMETCLPYKGSVQMINKWYEEGHIITFFTSRTDSHRDVTLEWLKRHGYKFNGLLMNKPRGGNYHWIDNHIVRATRYEGIWGEMVTKKLNIEVFE